MTRPKRPGGPRRDSRAAKPAREGGAQRASRPAGPSGKSDQRGPDGPAKPGAARVSPGGPRPGGRPATGRTRRLPPNAPVLDAPAPGAVFRDRDGGTHTFPESNLKRVAAQILTQHRKLWRYRPFPFPLFTDKGNEQTFHFDFYVYDHQEAVIRLILVVPRETSEVWDRVGRFKRQFPMYPYELWTPEKLARLQGPRARLGF
ncbi:hypothetical protein [Deinococcus pimensis]|uniref:hypothetical protein n=1 Tax=Deinococcus pimensis TaxID=309888 RepID=UPI0004875D1F|nr:hypothetical protein [Deinococcus pimensis]